MKIRKLEQKIDITATVLPKSEYVGIDGIDGRKIELLHNFNGILIDGEYLLSAKEAYKIGQLYDRLGLLRR